MERKSLLTRGVFLRQVWLMAEKVKKVGGPTNWQRRSLSDQMQEMQPYLGFKTDQNNDYLREMVSNITHVFTEHCRQIPDALNLMTYAELAYENYCTAFQQQTAAAA
jgi:hypothetical protein